MRKVLVFGTFDLLHPGHVYFLNRAKKYGDYLMVVIARDHNLVKLNKKLTVFSEKERSKIVSCLKMVDLVVLGDKGLSSYKIIEKYKPDVVCFGYDQMALRNDFLAHDVCKKLSLKIHIIPPYKLSKYTSTKLKLGLADKKL